MKIAEVIVVVAVLLSFIPFAVAFFIQQFRLPSAMRGARPSSFREQAAAWRDATHPFRSLVRAYVGAGLVWGALLLVALVAWQFIDTVAA